MDILIVAGVLLGVMLGLFFRWHVLILACSLIIVFGLLYPAGVAHSLLSGFLRIYFVTAGVQIGYVVGLLTLRINGGCNRLAAAVIATTPLLFNFPINHRGLLTWR